MELVDDFVKKYNEYINGGYRLVDSSAPLIEKKVTDQKYDDPMSYFLNSFIHDKVNGLGAFNLYKVELELPKNIRWIGSYSNYNLEYLQDPSSGKIALWDMETNEYEWNVAANSEDFFKSMLEVIEVYLEIQRTKQFDLDETYLREVYQKCMEINNNEEQFSEFYVQIVGII